MVFINLASCKLLTCNHLQARVIHNCSHEWLQIKEAAERARDAAISEGDEVGEMTCSDLLEALDLSRCLFLMKCKHKPDSILALCCSVP